jgi:hypothetical protein
LNKASSSTNIPKFEALYKNNLSFFLNNDCLGNDRFFMLAGTKIYLLTVASNYIPGDASFHEFND